MDEFNLCVCGPAVFLSCHLLPGSRAVGARKGPEAPHWEPLGPVPSCRSQPQQVHWLVKNGVTALGSSWPCWSHSSVSVCWWQRFLPKTCWNRGFVIHLQHYGSVTVELNSTRVSIPSLNDFQSQYLLLYLCWSVQPEREIFMAFMQCTYHINKIIKPL